jgi:hypothetical protein
MASTAIFYTIIDDHLQLHEILGGDLAEFPSAMREPPRGQRPQAAQWSKSGQQRPAPCWLMSVDRGRPEVTGTRLKRRD